ncbi:MAG TPA: thioesterase family protein [Gemmatimonadaceae bacterium]|nr:thioesterase family protein [Gemmatimonadaceae bacterium]
MPDVYRSDILIRFRHCDPAGIVFFPRYMEMFNDLVEDWCRDALGFDFNEIHLQRGWGLPTVHLDVDFRSPSVLGERLSATLRVNHIGTSSIGVDITLCGPDGAERVRGKSVLVFTRADTKRAAPIPDELRARITQFYAG